MTGLSTVPLGMRADEGVRPYYGYNKGKFGHRRLARGGSLLADLPAAVRRLVAFRSNVFRCAGIYLSYENMRLCDM